MFFFFFFQDLDSWLVFGVLGLGFCVFDRFRFELDIYNYDIETIEGKVWSLIP